MSGIRYKFRLVGTYRDNSNAISAYMLWNELDGTVQRYDKDTLANAISARLVAVRNARFKNGAVVCLDCDVENLPKYYDITMTPLDEHPSFILVATRGETVYLLHTHSFKIVYSDFSGLRNMLYNQTSNIVNVELDVSARKLVYNKSLVPEI